MRSWRDHFIATGTPYATVTVHGRTMIYVHRLLVPAGAVETTGVRWCCA